MAAYGETQSIGRKAGQLSVKTIRFTGKHGAKAGKATWKWATTPAIVNITCPSCQKQNEVTMRGAPDRVLQATGALIGGTVGDVGASIGLATMGMGMAATVPGAVVGGESGRKAVSVILRWAHKQKLRCEYCHDLLVPTANK